MASDIEDAFMAVSFQAGLEETCRLTEFVTILATINDKARQDSWQNPTYSCGRVPRGVGCA
jgi:hypothetical protein